MKDTVLGKVVKVELNLYHQSEPEVLYENLRFRGDPVTMRETLWDLEEKKNYNKIHESLTLDLKFYVQLGSKIYKREYEKIECKPSKRLILREEERQKYRNTHVFFELEKEDWYLPLQRKIVELEKKFCLQEHELLKCADELLLAKYPWKHFRTQVEIDGRIADGLAFVGPNERYGTKTKIIGFEAKADTDNYSRLYDQSSAYLNICDEVYLIIQNKKAPTNLPFYVGIICAKSTEFKVLRRATCLKHDRNMNECWLTLLKGLNTHCGVKKGADTRKFFQLIESIKRKLLWNQFVIGFHQTYHKDYVELTIAEKKIFQNYFGTKSK